MPFAFAILASASTHADFGDELAKVTANDGLAGDRFGNQVAIDGTHAVVAALQKSPIGAAYLIDVVTGCQSGEFLASDGGILDSFGSSVAIHGTTVIVGAAGHVHNGEIGGAAYLFDLSTGMEIAELRPDDPAVNLRSFGSAVALGDTFALVGAPFDDSAGSQAGSAYVFDLATGAQVAKLASSDLKAFDRFGDAVAIDGSIAIIGAGGKSYKPQGPGAAYLFDLSSGQQTAKLSASDGQVNDQFGSAVAIQGPMALVGAFGNNDYGFASGAAYLFDTATGAEIAKLLPSSGAFGEHFGEAVALSDSLAIIGAPSAGVNGVDGGAVFCFDLQTRTEIALITPGDIAEDDFFGVSVAVHGSTLISSSFHDDDQGTDSGSAYLIEVNTAASATLRNGSNLNGMSLSAATAPVIGTTWVGNLDSAGHASSLAYLLIYAEGSSGIFLPGGEVLVDLASPLLLSIAQVHTGNVVQYPLVIPNAPSLYGFSASLQGVVLGAPGYELSNALDIVIGL